MKLILTQHGNGEGRRTSVERDYSNPIDPRLEKDNKNIDKLISAGIQFSNDPFSNEKRQNRFVDVLSLLDNEITPCPSPCLEN